MPSLLNFTDKLGDVRVKYSSCQGDLGVQGTPIGPEAWSPMQEHLTETQPTQAGLLRRNARRVS